MFNKLQYISQGATSKEQFNNVLSALDGGCNWIQLRFKQGTAAEITLLAEQVIKKCAAYKATFIINDHPPIAHAIGADGVHVGLTDMNVRAAKTIMGDNKIIGGTANTWQHVLQRVEEGCSYIGLGPFRFTTTKEKLSPILGLQGYTDIIHQLNQHNISIPVYAIGGILLEDITALMQTGVYGVAVSGLITNHPDKKILIEQFNHLLYETVNNS